MGFSLSSLPSQLSALSSQLSICLCLCLCLCQTNLHMRVARWAPRDEQTLYTLNSACSIGGSAAGRSATPGPQRSSSWVLRRPTAAVVTKSRSDLVSCVRLKDQRSNSRTKPHRILHLSRARRDPWFRRTFAVSFCMRASHADVCPELLQNPRKPGDHIHDGTPHHGRRVAL